MYPHSWEDQIALNTSDEATFETLPPVGKLKERINWTVPIDQLSPASSLEKLIERDTYPLPVPVDREGYYAGRDYEYWLSGLEMHSYTMEYLKKYGADHECYVELGGASGRVIRHMAVQESFKELWTFDLNWRHTAWIQRYLPANIKAVNNTSIPHLPLEDHSVDCVSAMSVFTHIENFETAWLAEIRRVLKPGGIALISTVTEHQLEHMDETWPLYHPLTTHPRYNKNILNDVRTIGKIAFRSNAHGSYSSNVVYSTDYLKKQWSRFFDIVEYKRQFPIYQDLAILQKPKS